MLGVIAKYNVLNNNGLETLRADAPQRFEYRAEGGTYLGLRGLPLDALPEIDEDSVAKLCRIVRGLQFATADRHPRSRPKYAHNSPFRPAAWRAWSSAICEAHGMFTSINRAIAAWAIIAAF